MPIPRPMGFGQAVQTYRAEHEVSLQEAERVVTRNWLLDLLACSDVPKNVRTILGVLIERSF